MDTNTSIILSITLIRIVTITAGAACTYFGYRLFMSGVWGDAGNVKTDLGNFRLAITSAAPGTFFAVAGTLIICLSIYKGMSYETKMAESMIENIASETNPILPNSPLIEKD